MSLFYPLWLIIDGIANVISWQRLNGQDSDSWTTSEFEEEEEEEESDKEEQEGRVPPGDEYMSIEESERRNIEAAPSPEHRHALVMFYQWRRENFYFNT